MKGEVINCKDGRVIRDNGDTVSVFIPMEIRRRSGRKVVILPEETSREDEPTPFQKTYAKAYVWQKWLDEGEVGSIQELAGKVGLDASVVRRYLRLLSLSPRIVERFLQDDHPRELSLTKLYKDMPVLWCEQEERIEEWIVAG